MRFSGKTTHLKLSLYCGDRAENLPDLPPPTFGSHFSRFHPNRFNFGEVIAERVKTVFAPKSIYNVGSSRLAIILLSNKGDSVGTRKKSVLTEYPLGLLRWLRLAVG